MNVTVIGTGYVGLVTGACLAEVGNNVTCVDIDQAKIDALQKGQTPIHEPGLQEYCDRNVSEGRLRFTTNLKEGVSEAVIIFLALPTPQNQDGSADLTYVLDVADKLGTMLTDYVVVVNKSTVPVGTAKKVSLAIAKKTKTEFDVVSNPEFLREGSAVEAFMRPDRVVIGTSSQRSESIMKRLYAPFVKSGKPIIVMDEVSAEMTKYVANAMLANRISFMNQVANLSELVSADIDSIRKGVGTDHRIGPDFLYAGPGYGGSCFPKDTAALLHISKVLGYDFGMLQATVDANAKQKLVIPRKMEKYYGDLSNKIFGLWGLSFKANTDDIRESPALKIIDILIAKGASVVAYDPEAVDNTKQLYKQELKLSFAKEPYDALREADGLVIATEWPEFRSPDFAKIKTLLKTPVIFDARNLYDKDALEELRALGIDYESIGKHST